MNVLNFLDLSLTMLFFGMLAGFLASMLLDWIW